MIEIFKKWNPLLAPGIPCSEGDRYIGCIIEKCIAYMFLAVSAHFRPLKLKAPH